MDKNQVKKLKTLRKEALRKAVDDIKASDMESVDDNIRNVERFDRIIEGLSFQGQNRTKWIAAAIFAACLIVLWVLVEFRMPRAKIVVDLETTGIEFQLNEDCLWEDRLQLLTERLLIEHFEELQLPFPDMNTGNPVEISSLAIHDGTAVLDQLFIEKNSTVSIFNNTDQTLDIIFGRAPFEGRLQIGGEPWITVRKQQGTLIWNGKIGPLSIPETIRFKSTGAGGVKSLLRVKTNAQMVFNDLQVRRLVFSRPESGARFVSTIESGKLLLSDINGRRELFSGDRLSLEGPVGTIRRLSVGSGTKVRFEGTAEKILTGPEGHDYELTPTLLEYVYHNQRIGLISGAFLMVWGILWGAKRLLFP